MPIDHFFRSLAADQKNRSIGVILSGADHDGALGLKAIKAEGGITIVQTPESSRHPGMPRASIAADHVDMVLTPERIGAELARLGAQFGRPEIRRLEDEPVTQLGADEQVWTRLFALLSSASGLDFRQYKPATVQRRIARRMMLNHTGSVTEYLRYVQTHQSEIHDLAEDMLIKVTHFFRDPEAFDALQNEVLPLVVDDRPEDQPVRVWVPGCSTGEEAYSLAICLLEYQAISRTQFSIQVFGTDASEQMVQTARLARYPDSIAADISPERLRRFFVRTEKGYHIARHVRDLCIFARQDVCSDAPFSRIDLISCRNVLIYFNQMLQKQIIPVFHYALRSNGYLMLGSSETLRDHADLFRLADRRSKIYLKIPTPHPPLVDFVRRVPAHGSGGASVPGAAEDWTETELQRAADRIVMARYGPPGVVIDENMEILQTRGHTGTFLELAPGAPNYRLDRMLRESLAIEVRAAVERALATDLPVQVKDVEVHDGEGTHKITIEVLSLQNTSFRKRCFLVLFVPSADASAASGRRSDLTEGMAPDEKDRLVGQLRKDLSATKVYLQSLIEEREVRNQDLVAANEEVQSSNEELQSANEELETTKEEVQSANEELQTVNEELLQVNNILTQTSNDLNNLLASANIPLLMLSNDLEIRQFTPPIQRLFNVRSHDIGRPVGQITHNLTIDDIRPIVQQVIDSPTVSETEVRDVEGRWYLMRVRPYRTTENRIEGAVVILLDIDQLRRTQEDLRAARDFAVSVVESVHVPVAVLNMDLTVRTVNSAFRRLPGWTQDPLGHGLLESPPAGWNLEPLRAPLEDLRNERKTGGGFELEVKTEGPETRTFFLRCRGVRSDGDRVILLSVEETTERRAAEESVRATAEALNRAQQELRALTARLFQAQEDERRWVARELHDAVCQKLAVFDMEMESLQAKMSLDSVGAMEQLADLRRQAASLQDEVRSLSHRLHPSILDDLGLSPALRSMTEDFGRRENMLATFSSRGVPEQLPRETAASLYRIAQEALHNVGKHAGKTHVKVTLEGEDSLVRLQVSDLGHGFDPDDAHGGLGLISMAERARVIGGSFRIESTLGQGTTVSVSAPLGREDRGVERHA